MNLYDVIFYAGDGERDFIYTVVAQDHLKAAVLAEAAHFNFCSGKGDPGVKHADALCLLGQSALRCDAMVLHGPIKEFGYTRGKTWSFDEQLKQWMEKLAR